jgi:hypothetical protein
MRFGSGAKSAEALIGASVRLLLVALISMALVGCKKDEEVNATLATIDSFTTELVRRIEVAQNPSVGVDDAQAYFDSRKNEIVSKVDALRRLRQSQVSDVTKRKITSSLVDDASKVGDLEIKYDTQSLNDPVFKAKLDKLISEYQGLFTE